MRQMPDESFAYNQLRTQALQYASEAKYSCQDLRRAVERVSQHKHECRDILNAAEQSFTVLHKVLQHETNLHHKVACAFQILNAIQGAQRVVEELCSQGLLKRAFAVSEPERAKQQAILKAYRREITQAASALLVMHQTSELNTAMHIPNFTGNHRGPRPPGNFISTSEDFVDDRLGQLNSGNIMASYPSASIQHLPPSMQPGSSPLLHPSGTLGGSMLGGPDVSRAAILNNPYPSSSRAGWPGMSGSYGQHFATGAGAPSAAGFPNLDANSQWALPKFGRASITSVGTIQDNNSFSRSQSITNMLSESFGGPVGVQSPVPMHLRLTQSQPNGRSAAADGVGPMMHSESMPKGDTHALHTARQNQPSTWGHQDSLTLGDVHLSVEGGRQGSPRVAASLPLPSSACDFTTGVIRKSDGKAVSMIGFLPSVLSGLALKGDLDILQGTLGTGDPRVAKLNSSTHIVVSVGDGQLEVRASAAKSSFAHAGLSGSAMRVTTSLQDADIVAVWTAHWNGSIRLHKKFCLPSAVLVAEQEAVAAVTRASVRGTRSDAAGVFEGRGSALKTVLEHAMDELELPSKPQANVQMHLIQTRHWLQDSAGWIHESGQGSPPTSSSRGFANNNGNMMGGYPSLCSSPNPVGDADGGNGASLLYDALTYQTQDTLTLKLMSGVPITKLAAATNELLAYLEGETHDTISHPLSSSTMTAITQLLPSHRIARAGNLEGVVGRDADREQADGLDPGEAGAGMNDTGSVASVPVTIAAGPDDNLAVGALRQASSAFNEPSLGDRQDASASGLDPLSSAALPEFPRVMNTDTTLSCRYGPFALLAADACGDVSYVECSVLVKEFVDPSMHSQMSSVELADLQVAKVYCPSNSRSIHVSHFSTAAVSSATSTAASSSFMSVRSFGSRCYNESYRPSSGNDVHALLAFRGHVFLANGEKTLAAVKVELLHAELADTSVAGFPFGQDPNHHRAGATVEILAQGGKSKLAAHFLSQQEDAWVTPPRRTGVQSRVLDSTSFSQFGACSAIVKLDWTTGQPIGTPLGNKTTRRLQAVMSERLTSLSGVDVSGLDFSRLGSGQARSQSQNGTGASDTFSSPMAIKQAASKIDRQTSLAAEAPGRAKTQSHILAPWRLLTAHKSGHLLLWDFRGGLLRIVSSIGDPCAGIVGMSPFTSHGILVTAHSDGQLAVMPLPTPRNAPLSVFVESVPNWSLKRAFVRAHKGKITCVAFLGDVIATGSKAGGVKVWEGKDLRDIGVRDGLPLASPSPAHAHGPSSAMSVSSVGLSLAGPTGELYRTPSQRAVQMKRESLPSGSILSSVGPSGIVSPSSSLPFHPSALPVGASGTFTLVGGTATSLSMREVPGAAGLRYPTTGRALTSGTFRDNSDRETVNYLGTGANEAMLLQFQQQQQQQQPPSQQPQQQGHHHHHHQQQQQLASQATGRARHHVMPSAPASEIHLDRQGGPTSRMESWENFSSPQIPLDMSQPSSTDPANRPIFSVNLGQPIPGAANLSSGVKDYARLSMQASYNSVMSSSTNQSGGANTFNNGSGSVLDSNNNVPGMGSLTRAQVQSGQLPLQMLHQQQQPQQLLQQQVPQHPSVMEVDPAGVRSLVFQRRQIVIPPSDLEDTHPLSVGPYSPGFCSQVGSFGRDSGTNTRSTTADVGAPDPNIGGWAPPGGKLDAAQGQATQIGGAPLPPGHADVGAADAVASQSQAFVMPSSMLQQQWLLQQQRELLMVQREMQELIQRKKSSRRKARVSLAAPHQGRSHVATTEVPDPLRASQPATPPSEPMSQPMSTSSAAGPTATLAEMNHKHLDSLLDDNQKSCFINPDAIRLVKIVGKGAEGTVWMGKWHHTPVAVKEMHGEVASFSKLTTVVKSETDTDGDGKPRRVYDPNMMATIRKEVMALIDLGQHPNVIRFVGVCSEPARIVTEFYPKGSLYQLLEEKRQGFLTDNTLDKWGTRLQMLQDIAAGMAFLHSKQYIHGDLRSPNVFVTNDQHLKLGDFGFARILGADGNTAAKLTNPRWQAPESYVDNTLSKATDVYSFGIIMYELLTFRQPFDQWQEDEIVMCKLSINPDLRPPIPEESDLPVPPGVPLQPYKQLMFDCWKTVPDERPDFAKVAERLTALLNWRVVQDHLIHVATTLPSVKMKLKGSNFFNVVQSLKAKEAVKIKKKQSQEMPMLLPAAPTVLPSALLAPRASLMDKSSVEKRVIVTRRKGIHSGLETRRSIVLKRTTDKGGISTAPSVAHSPVNAPSSPYRGSSSSAAWSETASPSERSQRNALINALSSMDGVPDLINPLPLASFPPPEAPAAGAAGGSSSATLPAGISSLRTRADEAVNKSGDACLRPVIPDMTSPFLALRGMQTLSDSSDGEEDPKSLGNPVTKKTEGEAVNIDLKTPEAAKAMSVMAGFLARKKNAAAKSAAAPAAKSAAAPAAGPKPVMNALASPFFTSGVGSNLSDSDEDGGVQSKPESRSVAPPTREAVNIDLKTPEAAKAMSVMAGFLARKKNAAAKSAAAPAAKSAAAPAAGPKPVMNALASPFFTSGVGSNLSDSESEDDSRY